jgi:hypothetical protein
MSFLISVQGNLLSIEAFRNGQKRCILDIDIIDVLSNKLVWMRVTRR